MPKEIQIGPYLIGNGFGPFIIAEMSGNHNQSIEKALQIVDAVAESGAHALKIQTYTPDTMTLDLKHGEFLINDKSSLWNGKSLYELYGEACTPYEWHKAIFDRCKEKNLIYLSTPFDPGAVDFLEQFSPLVYKIASFENKDTQLIRRVAATGRPVIVSTGLSTLGDIHELVETFKSAGGQELILLKCTSSYPADATDANIKTIPHMAELFDLNIGLSDHTLGIGVAVAATALGASVIEKHFTISRKDGGVDSAFSMEPNEFTMMVQECRKAHNSLGKVKYTILESEQSSLRFKRSLYIAKDIKKGELLDHTNLRSIRPGFGLEPKFLDTLMGKRVNKDLPKGTPMSFDHI